VGHKALGNGFYGYYFLDAMPYGLNPKEGLKCGDEEPLLPILPGVLIFF